VIVVNFAHPLTAAQVEAIERLAKQPVEQVISAPAQFDDARSFMKQARALVVAVGLTPEQWQTAPLLVNLPSHNVIAALVLAELHGRTGHFPAVLRLRPVRNSAPLAFRVAQVVRLQRVRDAARQQRDVESEA
jgi:hypothetical protein